MADSLKVEAFEQFDKKWALVTAGDINHYNTMTISWGGLGTLWSKPVVTVYVKPIRYTWQFLNDNDYFTVSFYPEDCRKDLLTLGTKSGRDGNKVGETSLIAKECENGTVTFDKAEVTLLCKKIYQQDMIKENIPADVIKTYYETEAPHRMFVGEVIKVIK